jgi:hypothetical protein
MYDVAVIIRLALLHGKIETDIEAGSVITVAITNRYNTYKFDGAKHIVLSTTSWLVGPR